MNKYRNVKHRWHSGVAFPGRPELKEHLAGLPTGTREMAGASTATTKTQEEDQVPRATPEQAADEALLLPEQPHQRSLFKAYLVSCSSNNTQGSDPESTIIGCRMRLWGCRLEVAAGLSASSPSTRPPMSLQALEMQGRTELPKASLTVH